MKAEDQDIPRAIMVMVANRYVQNNQLDEAEKIFNTIKDDFPDFQISAKTILDFASALVEAQRHQGK